MSDSFALSTDSKNLKKTKISMTKTTTVHSSSKWLYSRKTWSIRVECPATLSVPAIAPSFASYLSARSLRALPHFRVLIAETAMTSDEEPRATVPIRLSG